MKITISGTLGSGKSTVAKLVANQLNYSYYYTGGLTRQLAEKRGMPLVDFTKLRETNPEINLEIDEVQKKIGETEKDFVIDSHLGFFFVPDSIKVFLKCNPEVAAERIQKSVKAGDPQRMKEGLKEDEKSILESLKSRAESELKQYKELYNINFQDETQYNLVIDTTNVSPQEVCDRIIEFVKRRARVRKGRKRA